jgi:hypothetical protein
MGGSNAETSWPLEHYASFESYSHLLTTLGILFRLQMMSPQAQALHEEHGHRRSRWCVDVVLIPIGARDRRPSPILRIPLRSQESRPTKNRYRNALGCGALSNLSYLNHLRFTCGQMHEIYVG